jgi:hypothetical protein
MVLGEQRHVVALGIARRFVRFKREILLAADDRPDAGLVGGLLKLYGCAEVVAIGYCDRAHAKLLEAGHQSGKAYRAVEKRIVRMHVKMHELSHSIPP